MKIVRVGDLARLDAMLDPAVADQLEATLREAARPYSVVGRFS